MKIEFIKMRFRKGLILLVAMFFFNFVTAQTVTDPWASLGASNIQTSCIAMDASNNLYVTNLYNSTISKITPSGTVTQAWATLAANSRPYGITIDASGNLYTVNRNSPYTVSKITPTSDGSSGTVIQTWATLYDEAYTITVDASGNIYVPYVSRNRIAKIIPNGATGTINTSWVTLATVANPFSISFDASGNLYTANSNNTISKITPSGTVIQAWATLAANSNPQFMVFDPTGNLFVSCWNTSTVSKINSSGTVTNVWSVGTNVWPAGIVLDDNGNIYTANYNNNTISKITSTGTVTQAYATLATGSYPFYLAKDTYGNLYNTNMGNGTVSKVSGPPSVNITSSASGAVCAGTNITFTANAYNFTSTPTYQWYKNSTAITGATSSTYSTTTLSNNDQINVTSTPGYRSGSISSSNLIANFDAANYNASSTRWNDLSPTGNHMDFYTSNTYSTLKTANYLSDGGGSLNLINNSVYGKTINNTGITGNGGKTITTWIKFDAADRDWTSIVSIGAYDNYAVLFELFGSRNGSGYQVMLVFDGGLVPGATTIPLNTWANVTIKADGSSLKVFVNGILDASGNQTLNTTNSPLYLGTPFDYAHGGWNDNLRGRMSTLSLYNTALSDQTILDNYNATKGRYLSSTSYNSNSITNSILASPNIPVLTTSGDGCIYKTTLTTATGLSAYQWYKDNLAISGATSNTYTPSASGVYQVQVSNGTCSNTSTATTIYNCAVDVYGRSVATSNVNSIISPEGGANFGTGRDFSGKLYNTTSFTTTSGTIGSTTAILGGVISATNAITSSIGIIYSTDASFGTYSTTTIQSNVTAGTYTTTISGLSSLTNYFAKSFVVNKAGTSYGPVVSFITTTPPKAIGDSYGGGKIFYILQSGDAGYDANVQHGLIAATSDQSAGNAPWSNNTNYTSAIAQNIGSGFDNTTKIISSQGSGTYAAKIARDYVASGYSDWYLPSYFELKALIAQKTIVGNFNSSWYWSSSESNNGYNGSTAPYAWIQQVSATSPNESGKSYSGTAVRPIRSF